MASIFFALDEALKADPSASQIKVIIPANLEDYAHDVRTNWCVPPVTPEAAETLIGLLKQLKAANPAHLIEMPHGTITQKHYDLRNIEEVKIADEVYAFQVNESTGTQHTIDQARLAGIPVVLHKKYSIE
jgi:hypothetical protein